MYLCGIVVGARGGIEMKDEMLKSRFGIEIEMTGITREKAAKVVAETVNGVISQGSRDFYDKKVITQKRKLQLMQDLHKKEVFVQ